MSKYSLWLIPDPRREAFLARRIVDLARRFDRVPFGPHATLIGQIASGDKSAREIAATLAAGAEAPLAKLGPLAWEDKYYRFLYYEIEKNTEISAFQELARVRYGVARRPFRPHISLMYADPRVLDAAAIATDLEPHGMDDPVRFDRLALVETGGHERDWRQIAEYSLGG